MNIELTQREATYIRLGLDKLRAYYYDRLLGPTNANTAHYKRYLAEANALAERITERDFSE